ncbi:hypothetical protein ACH5AL_36585 [Actinacidiphila glaucinigra]|uniref:hypothetical protein n=1 Tax=Actinacidiphila glaucinigra TaxID=235986 RepID=UPI0029A61BA4|nr:hypothetical protein [Streptomyces sp. PA03-3a]
MTNNFRRRLLLALDAQGYGSKEDWLQRSIQKAIRGHLDGAADDAGLSTRSWEIQPAGDGLLAVLPPDVPEDKVLDPLLRSFAQRLREHNRERNEASALRMRAAVHIGPATVAANGYSGDGPVRVGRLLDSGPLRRALAATSGPLAVAISEPLYRDVIVSSGCTQWTADDFRQVVVHVKETREPAWLCTPLAADIHSLDLSGPPAPEEPQTVARNAEPGMERLPEERAAGPGIGTQVNMDGGVVFHGPVTFGISK